MKIIPNLKKLFSYNKSEEQKNKETAKACGNIKDHSLFLLIFWNFLEKAMSYEKENENEKNYKILIKQTYILLGSEIEEDLYFIEKKTKLEGSYRYIAILKVIIFCLESLEKEITKNEINSEIKKILKKYTKLSLGVITTRLDPNFLEYILEKNKLTLGEYQDFLVPFMQKVFRVHGVVIDKLK